MLLSVESPNRGSLCTRAFRGHAAVLQWSGVSSPAGVGWEHVQTDNWGSPGTWEVLSSPQREPGRRHRVTNSRPRRRTCPPRSERNECNRGTAKRRKRSAVGWAARSRSTLIVLMKPGNWSRRTRWREGKTERGCLMLDPGPGNTSEASYSESRINVTTQDSIPGMQRLAVWRSHRQRNRMP